MLKSAAVQWRRNMAEESKLSEGLQVSRVFEQPQDAVSFYSDFANVMGTGLEVMLQFYETIPGAPGPGGKIQMVRSRLRGTVTISKTHAANIGRLLLKHAAVQEEAPQKGAS
jgi:hypothetical protein